MIEEDKAELLTQEDVKKFVFSVAQEKVPLSLNASTGVWRSIVEVFYRCVWFLYEKILHLSDANDLTKAKGVWLEMRGAWQGVSRRSASKTRGFISILYDGLVNIPLGTIFESSSKRKYILLIDFEAEGKDIVRLPVEAFEEGSLYNEPEGELNSTSVLSNVLSMFFSEDWITHIGVDQDSDKVLRERIMARPQQSSFGDIAGKFKELAYTVPGIVDCKIIRTPRNAGSMDIVLSSTTGMITASQRAIFTRLYKEFDLIGWDIQLADPILYPFVMKIEMRKILLEGEKENLEALLKNFCFAKGIGGEITPAEIYKIIGEKANLIEPIRNVIAEGAGILNPIVEIKAWS